MDEIPFALSVHKLVSSVGADAGFAAIVGLAILVLLYFAHARETSVLREQAAALAQRLEEAEARLAQAARQGIQPLAGQPQPPPQASASRVGTSVVAARSAGPAISVPLPPAAPAGVGAPALAAATHALPAGLRHATPGSPVPLQPSAPEQPAASPSPVPTVVPAAQPVAPATVAVPAPSPTPSAIPAPATAAGLATATAPTSGEGVKVLASNGGAAGRQAPALPQRPAAERHEAPPESPPWSPLQYPAKRGFPWGRRLAVVVVGLLVLAAIAALLIATSGNGTQTRAGSARQSNAPSTSRAAGFNPASVTVAVLNGTDVFHLAHRIALRLAADRYKQGTVTTASDQTETTTTVAYLPGYRVDAQHVAAALSLRRSAVQPVQQSAQQVACPGPGVCAANVVVTVGADLANS